MWIRSFDTANYYYWVYIELHYFKYGLWRVAHVPNAKIIGRPEERESFRGFSNINLLRSPFIISSDLLWQALIQSWRSVSLSSWPPLHRSPPEMETEVKVEKEAKEMWVDAASTETVHAEAFSHTFSLCLSRSALVRVPGICSLFKWQTVVTFRSFKPYHALLRAAFWLLSEVPMIWTPTRLSSLVLTTFTSASPRIGTMLSQLASWLRVPLIKIVPKIGSTWMVLRFLLIFPCGIQKGPSNQMERMEPEFRTRLPTSTSKAVIPL